MTVKTGLLTEAHREVAVRDLHSNLLILSQPGLSATTFHLPSKVNFFLALFIVFLGGTCHVNGLLIVKNILNVSDP